MPVPGIASCSISAEKPVIHSFARIKFVLFPKDTPASHNSQLFISTSFLRGVTPVYFPKIHILSLVIVPSMIHSHSSHSTGVPCGSIRFTPAQTVADTLSASFFGALVIAGCSPCDKEDKARLLASAIDRKFIIIFFKVMVFT
jgi:hypothetical protein